MTKINKILICSVILSALLGCLTSCTKLTAPKPFWEQLGIEAEDLEEIRLTYRKQDVVLDQKDADDLVKALTQSEPTTVEEKHEFTPSDIGVTFAAGGKEYPVTFYWFPYYETPGVQIGVWDHDDPIPENGYRLIGNRFDVIIGDKKYHYRFTSDKVWQEDRMRSVYDKCASWQNLFARCQLDGADRGYTRGGMVCFDTYSLDEILAESSMVVLATYQGEKRDESSHNINLLYDWDRFYIDEVLKGDADQTWCELPTQSRGKTFRTLDNLYIAYPVVYDPYYQVGTQYLICIREEGALRHFGQYTTAVLDGDTLFPRFNTEDHPFYNVKLQEVIDRIAEIQ